MCIRDSNADHCGARFPRHRPRLHGALMSKLVLRGIGKHYGDTPAVSGLDLALNEGEFVSLLGPSGCGKTTTLRMIAGFIDVDAGDLMLDGKRINGVPSHKRGAAMVFQN